MKIPMVEGMVARIPSQMIYGEHYEISCPHSSHGVGHALAITFAPSDHVVVIRKSDYEALIEKVTHLSRCLGDEKPWLVQEAK